MLMVLGGALYLYTFFAMPTQAQSMSDDQIEQMASAMRASGQSDEKIDEFVEKMKGVQKLSQNIETHRSTELSEMQAARKAGGMTDQQIAEMDKVDKDFAALERRSFDMAQQLKIKEFEDEFADHPDAKVVLGSQSYTLKVMKCTLEGETFNIETKGPPGPNRLLMNAGRSEAHSGSGNYREWLGFQNGIVDVFVKDNTGTVSGKHFTFNGQSIVINRKTQKKTTANLSVDLTCP